MGAQVGNNHSRMDHITRTGSAATRGSAKGFLNVRLPVTDDQLLSLKERREVLAARKHAVDARIGAIRETLRAHGHCTGLPFRRYLGQAEAGRFNNSTSDSLLVIEAVGLIEQAEALTAEMKAIKDQLHGQDMANPKSDIHTLLKLLDAALDGQPFGPTCADAIRDIRTRWNLHGSQGAAASKGKD